MAYDNAAPATADQHVTEQLDRIDVIFVHATLVPGAEEDFDEYFVEELADGREGIPQTAQGVRIHDRVAGREFLLQCKLL